MRILVFCSDLLPLAGLPSSGGGLRCWQIIQSLRRLGHDVTASMPLFTYLGRRFADIVDDQSRANAWTLDNQDELVDRVRPDAVVFSSSWIADRLRDDHDCLMVYDLHGPQLLEQHYKREHNVAINAQVKVDKLAKADYVVCAGRRQRDYFLPFLLLAGFDVPALERFGVVPIACPPELPQRTPSDRIDIVLGGGFFPWQDPTNGMVALGEVLRQKPRSQVRVRVFGASHGITGDDDAHFAAIVRELSNTPGIVFEDFVAHDVLVEAYRSASLALDLHARNPERELAFPTRTVEYLWCGLPVVTNDFGELSQWIAEYQAGWLVDPSNVREIRDLLTNLLDCPELLDVRGRNAQRLAQDRLVYDRVVGPLADFLRAPSPRIKPRPVKVLPMAEYCRLLNSDGQYRELLKSRALTVATTVAAWRRTLSGAWR